MRGRTRSRRPRRALDRSPLSILANIIPVKSMLGRITPKSAIGIRNTKPQSPHLIGQSIKGGFGSRIFPGIIGRIDWMLFIDDRYVTIFAVNLIVVAIILQTIKRHVKSLSTDSRLLSVRRPDIGMNMIESLLIPVICDVNGGLIYTISQTFGSIPRTGLMFPHSMHRMSRSLCNWVITASAGMG